MHIHLTTFVLRHLRFGACCLCLLAACESHAATAEAGYKKNKQGAKILLNPDACDGYTARASGDWNSDIWGIRPANEVLEGMPVLKRGLRPKPGSGVDLNAPSVSVTLSDKVTVNNLRIMRDKGRFTVKKGGALTLEKGYDGQGGFESSGEVDVQAGGSVSVSGSFCVAGANNTDTGTGTFTQNGGNVTVAGTIFLTGPRTMSSSAQATGIYNLNAGTLCVDAPAGQAGLRNGIGKGFFNFNGGTLILNRCDLDLDNKGGNLSPGGDAAVGETALVGQGRTYTQEKKARLTINIAGKRNYDRVVWTSEKKDGKVVLAPGTTIWVSYLDNYRAGLGDRFEMLECDALEMPGEVKLEGPAAKDFSLETLSGKKTGLALRYGR